MTTLHVLRVFVGPGGSGGNPLGVFLDAAAIDEERRQAVWNGQTSSCQDAADGTGRIGCMSLPVIKLEHLTELPDGRVFEWEAVGEGEPLLWLEGGPGFPAHLSRPDVNLLGRRFRCYLVNAPGCGRTSAPADPNEYSLLGHARFFDDARRALGLDQVVAAGHSWGALVAIAIAASVPQSIGGLLVVDGYAGSGSVDAADADAERERALGRLLDRPWFGDATDALARTFALTSPTEQEMVDTFAPCWPLYFGEPESATSRRHIERLRREVRWNVDVSVIWDARWEAGDYRDLAARVRCPTLVIAGEHDFICGPVWNRAVAEAVPGARYVEIAGVGHIPQYEDPDAFLAAVDDWMATAWK